MCSKRSCMIHTCLLTSCGILLLYAASTFSCCELFFFLSLLKLFTWFIETIFEKFSSYSFCGIAIYFRAHSMAFHSVHIVCLHFRFHIVGIYVQNWYKVIFLCAIPYDLIFYRVYGFMQLKHTHFNMSRNFDVICFLGFTMKIHLNLGIGICNHYKKKKQQQQQQPTVEQLNELTEICSQIFLYTM